MAADDTISKTQSVLGKVCQKTPLTAKLLSKPPFRYLHDLITEVIRNTGYAETLYTEDEMNSANITDKEGKVAFLQKIIDQVASSTGEKIAAKPSKIVAGLDAEETNVFLQLLVAAATGTTASKTSNSSPKKKSGDVKAPEEKAARRSSSKGDISGSTGSLKKPTTSKPKTAAKKRPDETSSLKKSKSSSAESFEGQESGPIASPPVHALASPVVDVPLHQNLETFPEPSLPTQKQHSVENDLGSLDDFQDSRRRPARPTTARPAPPRAKKPESEVPNEVVKEAPQVILEKNDDEDSMFQVSVPSSNTDENFSTSANALNQSSSLIQASSENTGLVQKILDANKSLVGNAVDSNAESAASFIANTRAKEKIALRKEMEQLRESIQLMCKSVAPLGKTMNYFQEDLESMTREISMWAEEIRKNKIRVDQEMKKSKQLLAPLDQQLATIEKQITEQNDNIRTVKQKISQNEVMMQNILGNVLNRAR